MNCILPSVKKMIGIAVDDDHFDVDITTHINTAFANLTQIGAGPSTGFVVADSKTTWDLFETELVISSFIKTYVYLKTKLAFDPPPSSAAVEAMKANLNEVEWRISDLVESRKTV